MAREALSANIAAPIFGAAIRSTHPTRGFEPGTGSLSKAEANAMQSAFRGKLNGATLISTPPGDVRVALNGHSGLFSLKAFVGLRQAPPPPPVPVPVPVPGGIAVPAHGAQPNPLANPLANPPALANPAPAHNPVAPQPQAPAPGLQERLDDAMDHVAASRDVVRALAARTKPASVADQAGAMSVVSRTLSELRAIETETIRAGGNAPGLQQVHAAQKACVGQMLELLRPELAPGLRSTDAVSAAWRDGMLESVCNLDAVLQDAAKRGGDAGYTTEKLIGLLSRQAGLAGLPAMPPKERFAVSAGRVADIAESMIASITPPRDGAALNSLVGINAELDTVLKLARRGAIETLMTERFVDRSGYNGPGDLTQPQRDTITAKAKEIVEADAALAVMKRQLQSTLQRAGAEASINGLGGLRVDAALVKGLRQAFGADAKQVGVTIAALRMAQQAALDSASSRDLRSDMAATLVHLRADRDNLAQQLAALPPGDPARAAMLAERQDVVAEIGYFENRLRGLSSERENALDDLNATRDSVQSLQQQRAGLVADVALAKRDVARVAQSIADLKQAAGTPNEDADQLDAMLIVQDAKRAVLARLNTELAVLEDAGGKPGRLTIATKAMHAAETRHDAAVLGEQVSATRTGLLNAQSQLDAAPGAQHLREVVSDAEDRASLFEGMLARNPYGPAQLTGGLTAQELTAMGLSEAESQGALDAASKFARQGLSSAEQVKAAVADVNDMMTAFSRKSALVNAGVDRQGDLLRSAREDQKPRVLADTLVRSLTGDPGLDASTAALAGPARQAFDARMGASLATAAQHVGNLGAVVNGPLSTSAQGYARAERQLLQFAGQLADLDGQKQAARATIQAFDPNHDLDRPEGLRAAKALMGAVSLAASIRYDTATDAEQAEFAQHLDALRGFDQTRMQVPFWQAGRARMAVDDIMALGDDQNLMQVASAIIFLRENEGANRLSLHRDIGAASASLDRARADHAAALGTDQARTIRDAVRLAALATMTETGQTLATFQPSEHGDAIRARLAAWQMPVDDIAPEVNAVLSDTFGPAEIENWRRFEPLGTAPPPPSAILGRGTRDALLGAVDQMQVGTRVKVNDGGGVQLQTGNIPVAPAVTVNAKVAVGQLGALDVARVSDGYELIVRRGWEGKAGAEAAGGISGVPVVKLQGYGGLEGAGARLAGVSLKFGNDAGGREALKTVLGKLFSGQELSARELSSATEILPVVESRYGGKAYVGAKAAVGITGETFAGKAGSATLSGGAAIQASLGQNVVVQTFENTNLRVFKKDRETVVELSGVARLQLGLGFTGASASTSGASDAVSLQAATSVSVKTRITDVYGSDGLLKPATIRQNQVHPPRGPLKWAAVEAAGGTSFTAALGRLDQAKRDEIQKLVSAAGSNDMFSITYTLDPAAMNRANDCLMQASALRERGGSPLERQAAAKLEKQAQDILDDDANFRPSRFQLIATQDTMATINAMNLVFVQVSAYVEDKGEWVAAEIALT